MRTFYVDEIDTWSIANTFKLLFLHKHSNDIIFVNSSFFNNRISHTGEKITDVLCKWRRVFFVRQNLVLVSYTLSRVKKATLPQAQFYTLILRFCWIENWTIFNIHRLTCRLMLLLIVKHFMLLFIKKIWTKIFFNSLFFLNLSKKSKICFFQIFDENCSFQNLLSKDSLFISIKN